MKFSVLIKQKGLPDFEPTFDAANKISAEKFAVEAAKISGWPNPRVIRVVEVTE